MTLPPLSTEGVGVLVLGLAAFGLVADKSRWGGWLSGPVWIVILAAMLANAGVLPHKSPVYDVVAQTLVPVAVALFLLKANVRRIFRETGRCLMAFGVGTVATLIGLAIGVLLFAFGQAEPKVAAVVAANLIGGTVNIVAVAHAIGFTDASQYGALLAGSALAMILYFALVGAIAARLVRQPAAAPLEVNENGQAQPGAIGPLGLLTPLLIAGALVVVSRFGAALIGKPELTIIFVTVAALIVANLAPRRMSAVRMDIEFGTVLMFCFFATIGAALDLRQVPGPALLVAAFTLLVSFIHLGLIALGARLFRYSLAEALVASVACIMGPTTAAGFAGGRGWRDLVTPAVLVGVLGIAVANFIGLTVFGLLS